MELFKKDAGELVVAPEVRLLAPFKKLFDRTEDKELARKELAFIYYYADTKSDYSDIIEEEVKAEDIRKDVLLPKDWQIDDDVWDAIHFYIERSTTISSRLLTDARHSVDKLSKFLRDIDLAKTDAKGTLVYNPSQITSVIEKLPKLVDNLKKLEEQVLKEKEEDKKMRGTKEKNLYEDGI